jgi:phage replication initiation protein
MVAAPSSNTGLKVRPDWLQFTALHRDGWSETVCLHFELAIGSVVRPVPRVTRSGAPLGFLGFEHSAEVVCGEDVIGRLAWGGAHTGGRVFVSLTGDGCARVQSWFEIVHLLEKLDARITRLDLAADFIEGEVSVDEALAAFRSGAFNAGGSPPSARLVDDLGSGAGRTLYVGSGKSSKLCRIYEKGRQLGLRTSPWVRVEVQFRNRCYEVPHATLLDPAGYLAGSYPVLREWIAAAALPLHAIRRAGAAVVEKAVLVARQHVGGVVAYLRKSLGWSASRVVNHLEARDPSARLKVTRWQAEFLPQGQLVTEACVMRWQPERWVPQC